MTIKMVSHADLAALVAELIAGNTQVIAPVQAKDFRGERGAECRIAVLPSVNLPLLQDPEHDLADCPRRPRDGHHVSVFTHDLPTLLVPCK